MAAEWTQFVGWLHAEARNDAEAVRVQVETGEQADAVDSGPLGDRAAADNLRTGLTGLPADQRDAEGTQEYRQALVVAPG
ncbi:hypothetical protein [Micromonospora sp. NPDC023956]|uniref:hypothetical protein n=1 Tax=Micromonospora sp. NPDC023956 TaxID=3155722 RepID=UPI0033F1D7AC